MKKKKEVVDIQLSNEETEKKVSSQFERNRNLNQIKLRLEDLAEEKRLKRECRDFDY